jgi:hypothetical protein
MRNRTLATVAFSLAVAAAPLLAQQANAPAGGSSPAGQTSQAQSATMPDSSGPVHLTGTVISVSDNRIEVKVESATTASTTSMVGSTQAFALDATSEKPDGLKVGDQIDLWFKGDQADHLVTRISLAASTGAGQSATATDASGSTPPANTSPQSSEQGSSMTVNKTEAAPAASQATNEAPARAQAQSTERRGKLPQSGSSLPLVGLVGLLTLGVALGLRFVVKV